MARRTIPEHEKQAIIKAANTHNTMMQAAESLDIPYRTFIERAKKLGVYKPNQNPIGRGKLGGVKSIPLNEILKGKHPNYPTNRLKTVYYKKKSFKKLVANVDCVLSGTINH